MKRILSALLILILMTGYMPAAFAEAAPEAPTTKHICLMDANTGAVLYEKDARSKAYPASTTKIMTTILALEMCDDLNDVVNVGTNFDQRGSLMKFVSNEELRVIDLIYGTMMVSGNDAASALAVHIAGSQDEFAKLMNAKAKEIGMNDTHFVKANGLHKDDHYSTAYDMALLGRYAMQNEKFREIASAQFWSVPPTNKDSDGYQLENANRLIHMNSKDTQSYVYNNGTRKATGIKTGDTDQAGRCIVASAKDESTGVELICVLFGDPQGDKYRNTRYENAAKFFDWGFDNYSTVSVSELNLESSFSVPVENGSFSDGAGLTATADLSGKIIAGTRDYVSGIMSAKDTITATVTYKDGAAALTAPINAGDEVGTVTYVCNGTAVLSVPITADSSVDEIGNVMNADPSDSPLLFDPGSGETGSPWLFWVLIVIAALAILTIARILILRSNRRRRKRRRGASARSRSSSQIRSRSRSRRFK